MPVDNQQDRSIDNFQLSWCNLFRICPIYIRRYLKTGRNKRICSIFSWVNNLRTLHLQHYQSALQSIKKKECNANKNREFKKSLVSLFEEERQKGNYNI